LEASFSLDRIMGVSMLSYWLAYNLVFFACLQALGK
jgi:hypothetical protein